MKTIEIMNAKIMFDDFSLKSKPKMQEFLDSEEMKRIIEMISSRFYMVLGGDGTMLRAIQETYKDNLPYLGINFGSKGFLLNSKEDALHEDRGFATIKYPLLDVEVDTGNGVLHHMAFNETQIKTAGGHITDLNLQIGDHSKMRLRGDGVLIVTPAGSTGYNISAGGPALPHTSKNFIATPLLTFEPRHVKPIVFENNETVTITNNNERGYELSVYADSTPVIEKTNKDMKIVIRKSKKAVNLLIAKSSLSKWNSKVYREQGFEFIG